MREGGWEKEVDAEDLEQDLKKLLIINKKYKLNEWQECRIIYLVKTEKCKEQIWR